MFQWAMLKTSLRCWAQSLGGIWSAWCAAQRAALSGLAGCCGPAPSACQDQPMEVLMLRTSRRRRAAAQGHMAWCSLAPCRLFSPWLPSSIYRQMRAGGFAPPLCSQVCCQHFDRAQNALLCDETCTAHRLRESGARCLSDLHLYIAGGHGARRLAKLGGGYEIDRDEDESLHTPLTLEAKGAVGGESRRAEPASTGSGDAV